MNREHLSYQIDGQDRTVGFISIVTRSRLDGATLSGG